MDRAGLAITTILANAVLQADARSSKITTWLDVFFNISTSFQFLTFFMSVITAHYVFDPDYITENDIIEEKELKAQSRRSVAMNSEDFDNEPKDHKYNFAEQVLRFTDSILGDEKDMTPDRIGRRVVVPVFLLITMILPFVPRTGIMSTAPHPGSGVNSILFKTSLALFLAWLLVVIVKVSLECSGSVAAGLDYEERKAKSEAAKSTAGSHRSVA